MAKLKTENSWSDLIRNKSRLVNKLISTPYPSDDILNFGYYMATQSDHLYNLSYYIDQFQNYKRDIVGFQNKYELYSNMFTIFTSNKKCSSWGDMNVSVYIDNIYILTNKELKYGKEEYFKKTRGYEFAIDRVRANEFDLKSNINKNILLRILCGNAKETAEITIDKSLTDLGFEDFTDSGLDSKLSVIIVKTVTEIHERIKQRDE